MNYEVDLTKLIKLNPEEVQVGDLIVVYFNSPSNKENRSMYRIYKQKDHFGVVSSDGNYTCSSRTILEILTTFKALFEKVEFYSLKGY